MSAFGAATARHKRNTPPPELADRDKARRPGRNTLPAKTAAPTIVFVVGRSLPDPNMVKSCAHHNNAEGLGAARDRNMYAERDITTHKWQVG